MSPLTWPCCRGSLVFFAVLVCAVPVLAQNPEVPADKDFRRSRAFTIPFTLPVADRTRTRQVKLWVRAEPSREWDVHATASVEQLRGDPRSREVLVGDFDVRLDNDGAYQFAVMTLFADGSTEPPSKDRLEVSKRIIVDTRPPAVSLKALPNKSLNDGNTVVSVDWKVEDENLARNSLRLEGRWFGDVAWKDFARGIATEATDKREYTLRPGQRLELRLFATDRAGNQSWKNIVLGAGVGNVTGNSGGGSNAGPEAGPILGQPTFKIVNQNTVNLSYRVRERPPSGLEKLELYWTRLGSKWEKYNQPFAAPAPDAETADVAFNATEDGTYGFIMIATSRAGVPSQAPPQANATPQLWVEVDTKKPEAKLKNVKLANAGDGRTMVLEWEAKDKNLEALPILFYYAELDPKNNLGEWRELVSTPLPNNTRYVCATPQLSPGAYQFKVKMAVFDKAQNFAEDTWEKPISADVAKPQIEIFDAKTPKGPPGAAPAEPPAPAKDPMLPAPAGPGA